MEIQSNKVRSGLEQDCEQHGFGVTGLIDIIMGAVSNMADVVKDKAACGYSIPFLSWTEKWKLSVTSSFCDIFDDTISSEGKMMTTPTETNGGAKTNTPDRTRAAARPLAVLEGQDEALHWLASRLLQRAEALHRPT
ncbi:hypothetical protein Tco_0303497 [Tanacetum coccineum]